MEILRRFDKVAELLQISQQTLIKKLKTHNILNKNNKPYEKYREYFIIKKRTVRRQEHEYIIDSVLVTELGVELITKILNKESIEDIEKIPELVKQLTKEEEYNKKLKELKERFKDSNEIDLDINWED